MYFIYYLAFGAAFYTWLFWRAEYERGACRWSKWSGRIGVLFVAAVLLALSGCTRKEDVGTANAYIAPDILRDPETGCQYLSHPYTNSALTPRLDRDGKQVCK